MHNAVTAHAAGPYHHSITPVREIHNSSHRAALQRKCFTDISLRFSFNNNNAFV